MKLRDASDFIKDFFSDFVEAEKYHIYLNKNLFFNKDLENSEQENFFRIQAIG